MWYGRGKLAHVRRGKLAYLLSMNKDFQESIQYFIAFRTIFLMFYLPKQKIYTCLLENLLTSETAVEARKI